MLHRAAAAIVAAFAFAGSAFAQTETYNDTVYTAISPADLRGIVQGLGYASVTDLDATSFEISTSSGFLFYVYAVTCDEARKGANPTRCVGVEIATSWTIDAKDIAAVRESADAYNRAYSLLRSYVDDEGSLRAQRYGFLNGGVTRAHIEQEIVTFLEAVDYLLDDVFTDTGLEFIGPY